MLVGIVGLVLFAGIELFARNWFVEFSFILALAITVPTCSWLFKRIIYAYNETGMLVSEENLHLMSDEDLERWREAVDEARRMFEGKKV